MCEKKIYLDNGVYVRTGDYLDEVVLTAEHGISATQTIVMDLNMIQTLIKFCKIWGLKV